MKTAPVDAVPAPPPALPAYPAPRRDVWTLRFTEWELNISTACGKVDEMRLSMPFGSIAALSLTASLTALPPLALADSPSTPWRVSSLGDSQHPACNMSGEVGLGRLDLTILGDAPGFVHLQLDKASWRLRPGGQVRLLMSFAGYQDVPLTAIYGGGASVLAMLTAKDLPGWMHGFTAAHSATIAFAGTAEPSWTFDLHGTTAAVNALQKCVLQTEIAGVPPPFKSAAITPPRRF